MTFNAASFNASNLTERYSNVSFEDDGNSSLVALTFYGVMAFLIILANSLVLFLVWRKANLRSISNAFLTSLAVSDLSTGLLAIPLVIICSSILLEDLCIAMDICNRFLAFSSVGHLTVLSIDRYLRIIKSLEYPSIVTEVRARGAIGAVWTFAFIASGIQLFWIKLVNDDEKLIRIELAYDFICLAFVVIIPLFVMSTIYVRIFVKLSRHTANVDIEMSAEGARQHGGRRRASEKKVAMLFLAMIAVFILGLLLYFLWAIIIDLENIGHSVLPLEAINIIEKYILFFRFFTALSNPILCTFFKNDFRQAFKQLIHC